MTAHSTKGTTAAMNPAIPPVVDAPAPNRKPNPPDNSAPKQQQQQEDVHSRHAKPPASHREEPAKSQQQRAPEATTANVSTASSSGATESTRKTSTTIGDSSGDVIGEYVLGETIGKGTFGKVKLGLHLLTGEKVAVKILEKKRIVQAADVERVAREIKILKRNRHLNVIQLYEVIDSPDCIFLIMEHVDGGEMFEYIVAHHRIREPEAAFLFRQIVDGLAYLHANEITHRDLKPENLLLQANRRHHRHQRQQSLPSSLLVKIVDFGLSNTHDGGRLLRTACGSPCYAAPEMIQGRLYHGPVADMWSLGVVLFAMVCGFLPFEDSNTNLLYKKILSANYKMPSFLSPNAQDLIRHILETDPEKRYTVDMIRQHAWLAGVPSPETLEVDADDGETNDEANARHELVLNQLEGLGLPQEDVRTALAKKTYNRLTASYYLLDGKLQRTMNNRVVSVSVNGNSASGSAPERVVRRKTSAIDPSNNSGGKRPDRSEEVARSTASMNAPAGHGKHSELIEAPQSQTVSLRTHEVAPEAARRRSITNHHQASHPQQHGESPYARRAVTPSSTTASPRQSGHHTGTSNAVQRPSSVRGGRNLVQVIAGHAIPGGPTFVPVAPNPPRDHRHSGVLAPRKAQANSRVTISNGMVALRPLLQPVHAVKREPPLSAAQSSTRRYSMEGTQQHMPPPQASLEAGISPLATTAESQTSRVIVSTSGATVIRRRPSGAAPLHHAVHIHNSHQPTAVASAVPMAPPASAAAASPLNARAPPSSVAKTDDTRSPQRIAPPSVST